MGVRRSGKKQAIYGRVPRTVWRRIVNREQVRQFLRDDIIRYDLDCGHTQFRNVKEDVKGNRVRCRECEKHSGH